MIHNCLGRGHVLLQLCPESRFLINYPVQKSEEASRRNHILRGTQVITTSVLHIILEWSTSENTKGTLKPIAFEVGSVDDSATY